MPRRKPKSTRKKVIPKKKYNIDEDNWNNERVSSLIFDNNSLNTDIRSNTLSHKAQNTYRNKYFPAAADSYLSGKLFEDGPQNIHEVELLERLQLEQMKKKQQTAEYKKRMEEFNDNIKVKLEKEKKQNPYGNVIEPGNYSDTEPIYRYTFSSSDSSSNNSSISSSSDSSSNSRSSSS